MCQRIGLVSGIDWIKQSSADNGSAIRCVNSRIDRYRCAREVSVCKVDDMAVAQNRLLVFFKNDLARRPSDSSTYRSFHDLRCVTFGDYDVVPDCLGHLDSLLLIELVSIGAHFKTGFEL